MMTISTVFWSLGALIAIERLVRGGDVAPRASAIYAFALLTASVSGALTLLTQTGLSADSRIVITIAAWLCAVSGGAHAERALRKRSAVVSS